MFLFVAISIIVYLIWLFSLYFCLPCFSSCSWSFSRLESEMVSMVWLSRWYPELELWDSLKIRCCRNIACNCVPNLQGAAFRLHEMNFCHDLPKALAWEQRYLICRISMTDTIFLSMFFIRRDASLSGNIATDPPASFCADPPKFCPEFLEGNGGCHCISFTKKTCIAFSDTRNAFAFGGFKCRSVSWSPKQNLRRGGFGNVIGSAGADSQNCPACDTRNSKHSISCFFVSTV